MSLQSLPELKIQKQSNVKMIKNHIQFEIRNLIQLQHWPFQTTAMQNTLLFISRRDAKAAQKIRIGGQNQRITQQNIRS